ncbi:hypothetical protein [Nonomuraea endophytica]|uniref:hypothetical protein n=1 Tax=Nonomuraea endophytica TaxID=714136 RepID=UPI0037CABBC7
MKVSELRGEHVFSVPVPGQATAGTEDDWVALVVPFNMTVHAIKWTPNAGITAHGTNYFVLQILNGATVVASRSYAATDSVALTAEDMTLSATPANLNVAAGAVLVVHKETTGLGTGLAMPDGTVQIHARGN